MHKNLRHRNPPNSLSLLMKKKRKLSAQELDTAAYIFENIQTDNLNAHMLSNCEKSAALIDKVAVLVVGYYFFSTIDATINAWPWTNV